MTTIEKLKKLLIKKIEDSEAYSCNDDNSLTEYPNVEKVKTSYILKAELLSKKSKLSSDNIMDMCIKTIEEINKEYKVKLNINDALLAFELIMAKNEI